MGYLTHAMRFNIFQQLCKVKAVAVQIKRRYEIFIAFLVKFYFFIVVGEAVSKLKNGTNLKNHDNLKIIPCIIINTQF